ncbi:MAG: hypothetical protein ABI120_12460 [Gemmatimonadaceae bacterium]
MKFVRRNLTVLIAFSAIASACKRDTPADDQQMHIQDVVAAGGVVDSILPIPVQLDRFQAAMSEKPDTLRHASPSINALIMRLSIAIAANDTAALNAMMLDRAEFAWLYYPSSKMSLPPYEAPPQLLWGQILASSNDGAQNLLKKFGSAAFKVTGVNCPKPPVAEGGNLLHEGCLLKVQTPGAVQGEAAYFGTIIERDKRFKFVSYASRL